MNASPELLACLRLLALVALEIALVIALAEAVTRLTTSFPWRRVIWQGCLAGLAILTLVESSGVGRELASWTRQVLTPSREDDSLASRPNGSPTEDRIPVSSPAPAAEPPKSVVLTRPRIVQEGLISVGIPPARGAGSRLPNLGFQSAPTPVQTLALDAAGLILIWMTGAIWFLGRAVTARLVCWNLQWRRRRVSPTQMTHSINSVAGKLGIHRRVRLIESARLRSPVAFGWWHPSIGIPVGFSASFSTAQQEAMFSHELAHLAGRDPFWYSLADLAAAFLWWHPLVWLARRRLRDTSERAADEASLLISNGPQALAECLVKLGLQLTRPSGLGSPGVEGTDFRSGLARRVEQLCRMREGSGQPTSPIHTALARTAAPMILVTTIIVGTAWTGPQTPNQGDSMKTIRTVWIQSMSALALLAMAEPGVATAALPPSGEEQHSTLPGNPATQAAERLALISETHYAQASATPSPAVTENPSEPVSAPATSVYHMDPVLRQRYGLAPRGAATGTGATPALTLGSSESVKSIQSRLDQIVFNDVQFESLPLKEVLKFLSDESRKRDQGKIGVNFLISPNTHSDPNPVVVIDPTTGTPVPAAQSEPLDMSEVLVNFSLPLRNVRLTDVLNAIVKVAEKPIRFSVEEYGVVFSLVPGQNQVVGMAASTSYPMPALAVRTFKVDTNTFLAGLESTFGISPPAPAADRSARSRDLQEALRKLMQRLGVNMEDSVKSVFYNDLTGVLMVRATPSDLELVEAAVETLGGGVSGQSTPAESAGIGGSGTHAGTAGHDTAEEMRRRYGIRPANRANSNNLK